jgi:hypothetical protein
MVMPTMPEPALTRINTSTVSPGAPTALLTVSTTREGAADDERTIGNAMDTIIGNAKIKLNTFFIDTPLFLVIKI